MSKRNVREGAPVDPIFVALKQHNAFLTNHEGLSDAAFNKLCAVEERKLQKLARMKPRTIAGVRALLVHVAKAEVSYINGESPIAVAMYTAAKALKKLENDR